MKFLLISINQQDVEEFKKAPTDISALGARYLSSYLKSHGREVAILFLSKPHGELETADELWQINNLVKKYQPDLVGLSLMSNHFFRAKNITMAIKKSFPSLPIIWGGIHPTIDPENCLKYADLVCVGEGESALLQLTENNNWLDYRRVNIPGLWYRDGDQIVSGGKSVLVENIDELPFPDYDFSDHYIIHQGELLAMTESIFRQYYPAARGDHRLLSSRGCPHACAYCCNSVFRNIYSGVFLRKRSVDQLIAEMKAIKEKFPFIHSFKIMDDSFAVNDLNWINEFNRLYKTEINLPFFCLASPTTIDAVKLELLVDAGLETIQIGLQSGSDRVNQEVYLRYAKSDQFLAAMALLDKYRGKLHVIVDVILDNPYENEADLLSTIAVLNQIKKPFHLSLFSLTFYPGTELYRRAIADGHLIDGQEYLKKQFHLLNKNYLNKVIYLIPRLQKNQIDYLAKNRNNPFIRAGVSILYLFFMKKNKIPQPLIKIMFSVKKLISH
ncbi:MAG: radical SAM protein [Candidatus Buchananbacteria bacterium]